MNTSNDITIYLVIGTLTMLGLAGSIILFVVFYQKRLLKNKFTIQQMETDYQKDLLQSTIDSQEKERKRIASDLHDGVGAMLSAAKLNLNMLGTGAIPPEELKEAVGETKEMINETIETVRRISKALLPSSLEKFGLSQALEELCEKLTSSVTAVVFYEQGEGATIEVSKQLLIYRIVQELVNNAIKHAEASEISVKFNWREGGLLFEVNDDGKGFDLKAIQGDIKKGVGLYNIENRASLLNGEVTFDSQPGQGTNISITVNKFE